MRPGPFPLAVTWSTRTPVHRPGTGPLGGGPLMEANSGLALRHSTPRAVYVTVHATSGGSAFPPRLPILIETGEGGPLDDPLHRFTFARCGLAVRRAGGHCSSGKPGAASACTSRPRRSRVSLPTPVPSPRACSTGPGPLSRRGIQRAASTARRGARGARARVPCSRSASPFWLSAGRNHTSFCRIRWERIRGATTELAAERGARLLFIATGRSTAGRGGRARAAGTRSLASRARQGASAGHAQATPPRGWSGNQICRGRSNNRLLEQLWDSSSAGPAAGPALRFQGEELAQAPGAAPGAPGSQTPPCSYAVGS